jgi:hypothetical protein
MGGQIIGWTGKKDLRQTIGESGRQERAINSLLRQEALTEGEGSEYLTSLHSLV